MKAIATVGGLGYFPIAPGTVGSAVGLGVAWILSGSPLQQGIGCLSAMGLTLMSAGPVAKKMGSSDPRPIVIDEVAGMMVGVVFLPVNWKIYLTGFLLFRALDIFKPGIIRWVEKLPGSWGILMDDLLAGLFTNLILRFLLPIFR